MPLYHETEMVSFVLLAAKNKNRRFWIQLFDLFYVQ